MDVGIGEPETGNREKRDPGHADVFLRVRRGNPGLADVGTGDRGTGTRQKCFSADRDLTAVAPRMRLGRAGSTAPPGSPVPGPQSRLSLFSHAS